MFGGLHIELAALKTLSDLLKCSGWTSALVHAGVATAGTADSFLTAAHITCTRRAHQVTACVLYQALEEAHQKYVLSTEPGMEDESLEDWCNQQSSLPMFNFWFTILQLQLTVLVFVCSIRTGDFELYVQSLKQMMGKVKGDRNLFSRLYVACQVRDGNLEEFFTYENQSCPLSLSDRGKLRLGKKFDVLSLR